MSPQSMRRVYVYTALMAGSAGALFLLAGLAGGEPVVRARKALAFAVIAQALVAMLAPIFVAGRAAAGGYWRALGAVATPVGWTLAAVLPGELLLAVSLDRGALGALLAAALVAGSAGLVTAGLVLALARLTRRTMLAATLAGMLVFAFALVPWCSLTAIKELPPERRGARDAIIAAGLRSPPMAAAYAFVGAARPVGWEFVPHTSNWFYKHWVGTDYPLVVPDAWDYAAEFLLAAVALGAAGVLRRAKSAGATNG